MMSINFPYFPFEKNLVITALVKKRASCESTSQILLQTRLKQEQTIDLKTAS